MIADNNRTNAAFNCRFLTTPAKSHPMEHAIKIRSNHLMKDLIGTVVTDPERVSATIPSKMFDELNDGFEEVCGVVAAKGRMNKINGKQQDDATGLECLLNKIHIDDYVNESTPIKEMVQIAICYALKLKDALLSSALDGPFRIIISGDFPGHSCSVRFHKLRPNQVWLADDIESYKIEALMVIDFAL